MRRLSRHAVLNRNQLLSKWIEVVASASAITSSLYEERSFLRDAQLRRFVLTMLDTLAEYPIGGMIDPSLAYGLTIAI